MPRKNHVPKYRLHKATGSAYVYHKSIRSNDHRQYLGKYGTEESIRRYEQFLSRLRSIRAGAEIPYRGPCPHVYEIILDYNSFSKRHYARPEKPLDEYDSIDEVPLAQEHGEMRRALALLLELYGDELAEEVGPKSLKVVREVMIERDYARSHINKTISRIKRFFRWACSEELIDAGHYYKLLSLPGLQRNELGARESVKIGPACPRSVQVVLNYLSPTVGAMVQIQYLCGMRPGEVCIMRECDIEVRDGIWWYAPQQHKNEWRGHSLIKAIPRSAQKILTKFMGGQGEYLFRPNDSVKWAQSQVVKKERKTPRYPSEVVRVEREKILTKRRVKMKAPGKYYLRRSYSSAVKRGVDNAIAAGEEITPFTPNQLRHLILTFVTEHLNQESAQLYAGHEKLETTSIYVEKQRRELERVANQLDDIWSA